MQPEPFGKERRCGIVITGIFSHNAKQTDRKCGPDDVAGFAGEHDAFLQSLMGVRFVALAMGEHSRAKQAARTGAGSIRARSGQRLLKPARPSTN